MAGSLIKIDEFSISSAVASVILGGGSSGSSGLNVSIDSTYDVYMLKFFNVLGTSGNNNLEMRVTESGTPNTTSNYDWVAKKLDATTSFGNQNVQNLDHFYLNIQVGNDTSDGEQNNGIAYIFNANNSSEYTFYTQETVYLNPFSGGLNGAQGGGVFTSASAVDGLNIFFSTGNIDSGTFTLYALKK